MSICLGSAPHHTARRTRRYQICSVRSRLLGTIDFSLLYNSLTCLFCALFCGSRSNKTSTKPRSLGPLSEFPSATLTLHKCHVFVHVASHRFRHRAELTNAQYTVSSLYVCNVMLCCVTACHVVFCYVCICISICIYIYIIMWHNLDVLCLNHLNSKGFASQKHQNGGLAFTGMRARRSRSRDRRRRSQLTQRFVSRINM